jgi:hypothetical protein
MSRKFPQFYMFPQSHENISFLQKQERRSDKIKRELFMCKGRFPYSCNLPRLGNTLELMPLNVQENALTRTGTSSTT